MPVILSRPEDIVHYHEATQRFYKAEVRVEPLAELDAAQAQLKRLTIRRHLEEVAMDEGESLTEDPKLFEMRQILQPVEIVDESGESGRLQPDDLEAVKRMFLKLNTLLTG